MQSIVSKSARRLLALAALASLPVALAAQAAPSAKGPVADQENSSKWDIFAGYSYLSPHDTEQILQPNGTTIPVSFESVNVGGLFSVARYFNRYVGLQAEYGVHEWGGTNSTDDNDGFQTIAGGLIGRYPINPHVNIFAHGLVGGVYLGGPDHNPNTWGPDITAGGGMDYNLTRHIALRLFQADYEYMHANSGTGIWEGRANVNAARLSAGIVFEAGNFTPPPPVTLACSASPASVFPGDPITITAVAGNLDPKGKESVIYGWSGQGASGNGTSVTIATGSLAAGTYTVQGTVKTGKAGKEGLKPWQNASCSASFTVKAFEPPTISCSANPTTIMPGGTATITSVGLSPQNRPLTYSYTASGGSVSGSGTTATFSSAGAATGAVGITCNVSDDKGHSATANTTVTIQAPPPPPQPHASALCSLSFSTDTKRPTRVDNEAKACLDQVALTLKQQADAKLVVVGESTAAEKADTAKKQELAKRRKRTVVEVYADQRAVNAKDYLVTDGGIDASRISVATGTTDGQTVEDYLVPSGANFSSDISGTTPVDESAVKAETRKPLPERHPAKK